MYLRFILKKWKEQSFLKNGYDISLKITLFHDIFMKHIDMFDF